jgi:DNA polymerase (family 10)
VREPVKLDLDQIFEACAENGVDLEINASPERLDLPDIHCQHAKAAGVQFVISTDTHVLARRANARSRDNWTFARSRRNRPV